MPCPYYRPSGTHCYCEKTGVFHDDAHVRNYCATDSNWQRCGNIAGTGGCFLTTACVHYAGLADDCKELNGMRNFRDSYLLSLSNGQAMYDEYYRLAPAIVEAIERSVERTSILTDILTRVRQCVHFADKGNNEMALVVYTSMFNELKNKFVPQ